MAGREGSLGCGVGAGVGAAHDEGCCARVQSSCVMRYAPTSRRLEAAPPAWVVHGCLDCRVWLLRFGSVAVAAWAKLGEPQEGRVCVFVGVSRKAAFCEPA